MEKTELFKLLLSKEQYANYRHRVVKEIFPEALHDLYESLEEAHKTTDADITCRDVWAIHQIRYPTLTDANKNVIKDILVKVNESQLLDADIQDSVVNRALVELKATKIAQASLEIAQGKKEDFYEIQRLLDDTSDKHDIEAVSTDAVSLTKEIEDSYRWEFNLPELHEKVGKIGPGLIILAGPVNSGKSAMGISFTFGPKGFAEQGARCVYVGNEENRKKLMLRGMSCYTGMTRPEIIADPQKAQAIYNAIKDNVIMVQDSITSFSKLEYIINQLKPDILVVDMLDKVKLVSTAKAERYMELGDIYARAREAGDKYQCAIFGLSQTNGDTFGQLTIDQNQLAGSRVDKAANADLILTLGQLSSSEEQNNFRRIFVAKTKSEGDKEKINCMIQPHLSRITP